MSAYRKLELYPELYLSGVTQPQDLIEKEFPEKYGEIVSSIFQKNSENDRKWGIIKFQTCMGAIKCFVSVLEDYKISAFPSNTCDAYFNSKYPKNTINFQVDLNGSIILNKEDIAACLKEKIGNVVSQSMLDEIIKILDCKKRKLITISEENDMEEYPFLVKKKKK